MFVLATSSAKALEDDGGLACGVLFVAPGGHAERQVFNFIGGDFLGQADQVSSSSSRVWGLVRDGVRFPDEVARIEPEP